MCNGCENKASNGWIAINIAKKIDIPQMIHNRNLSEDELGGLYNICLLYTSVLACIIFSSFAATPPNVDTGAATATMVWKYVGELIFNMLVLVGTIRLSDRIVREMMGL